MFKTPGKVLKKNFENPWTVIDHATNTNTTTSDTTNTTITNTTTTNTTTSIRFNFIQNVLQRGPTVDDIGLVLTKRRFRSEKTSVVE